MKREIDRARGNQRGGRLDVAQPGPGPGAFRTDAEGEDPCGSTRSHWRNRPAIARRPPFTRPRRQCAKHISGIGSAAKECAHAALELAKGRDVEYAAAFALALSGDSSGSQNLAEDLAKRFPEDTPVQFEYLPTLRALFALSDKAPLDAIERLKTALPYDLAMPGTAFFAKFGGLYPAYVRGQAYLAAGRAGRRRRNSKKSSIIAASFLPIRSAPWRTCNWAEPMLSRETDQGQKRLPGFPHPLEGCRRGHPRPPTGQGGIREAIVVQPLRRKLYGKPRLSN